MSTEALIAERASAEKATEGAQIALGQAVRSGDDAGRRKAAETLMEAQATVAAISAEIAAVEAADREEQRIAAEKAEREAEERLKARLGAAEKDLSKLRKGGAKIDTALASLDKALRDMDDECKAYLAEHESLGVHQSARDWVNCRGWVRPVQSHLLYRGHPELRRSLRQKYSDHWAGNTEESVPCISTILVGRRKPKTEKASA